MACDNRRQNFSRLLVIRENGDIPLFLTENGNSACRFAEKEECPIFQTGLPGGNSEREPPDPIPNSEVKTLSADGSVGSPHVRVGHRQALYSKKPASLEAGFFDYALREYIGAAGVVTEDQCAPAGSGIFESGQAHWAVCSKGPDPRSGPFSLPVTLVPQTHPLRYVYA